MIFKRSFVSELANSAGGVFTVLFTIVIAVGMVRILGMAAGGRIDNTAVLQMVLYNALTNLPPLLALSVFVAVLMTLMRWWQDNEMVVWFSSGGRPLTAWISPVLRFALPIVLLIALLAIVISPWAKSQTDLTRQAFKNRDEVNAIVPGRFIESMGGQRVIFIDSAGSKENEVGKVFMAETGKDKESVVTAESGTVEVNEEGDRYVVLHNGRRYETANESAATRLVEFDGYGVRFDLKLDSPMRAGKAATQPFTVLLAADTPESDAELLWRFSWPLAALNLALLAVPLSCTSPRAGRSLNLILAALIFILYLNGIVFLLVVLLFVRRNYLFRTPSWAQPFGLISRVRHRLARRKGKPS